MGERAVRLVAPGATALALALGCRGPAPAPPVTPGAAGAPPRGPAAAPRATEGAILVCGERVPIAAPVVPWFEPPRWDAYRTEPRFRAEGPHGLRYRPGRPVRAPRPGGPERSADPAVVRDAVELFVVHYDACGLSRTCFEILHDVRELSVHFLLDLDGTLYQTLDLAEEAWHARSANPRSIGVEIAHVGAYPPGAAAPLDAWYARDAEGLAVVLPPEVAARLGPLEGLLRRPGTPRPARSERVVGAVHGRELEQPDFTDAQYESLAALAAGLAGAFPRLELDAPRDAAGAVRRDALSPDELAGFRGVIGHWHVTRDKIDPGPAFDWERFLRRARELAAARAP